METKELQRKQAEYDKKYWEHNNSELELIKKFKFKIIDTCMDMKLVLLEL